MFTQDQLNTVVRSYLDDAVRIMEVKANYALTIQDLKNQLAEKNKEIEALKKPTDNKPEKEKIPEVVTTESQNGSTIPINSTP